MDFEFQGVICSRSCFDIVFDISILLNTLNVFNSHMDKEVNPHSKAGDSETIYFSNGQFFRWNDTWRLDVQVRLIITCFMCLWYLGTNDILETDLAMLLSSAFSKQFFSHGLSCVW